MEQLKVVCTDPECDSRPRALGLCALHYQRMKRSTGPRCSVDGCDKNKFGRGLCSMHYERWLKHGEVGNADRQIGEFMYGLNETERKRYHKYGITPDRFRTILQEQGNVCAICKDGDGQWHVDHDHRCCPGRKACDKCIRGVLCRKCNMSLGFVERNLEELASIERYLRSREDDIYGRR